LSVYKKSETKPKNCCNYTLLNKVKTKQAVTYSAHLLLQISNSVVGEYMFMYAITRSSGTISKGGNYVNGLQTMCTCNKVPDEASVPQC